MKIVNVESFILHVPLALQSISDATNTISHWGVVGVVITTDCGLKGYGYTGTHAHLNTDQAIAGLIEGTYGPMLMGQDANDSYQLWHNMARKAPVQWVGRSGIVHLALGAIDVALWDLRAKQAELPLWKFLGGSTSEKIEAYNTDIGWLSIPIDQMVDRAKAAVEVDGFKRLKIKVGQDIVSRDVERFEALRNAVGDEVSIAVDANGKWDLGSAKRFCTLAAPMDVFWLEEPLWFDDVAVHAELAGSVDVPIALGEQLYNAESFAAFVGSQAMAYAQPDVTRLAGITEYLQVAEMCQANRVPVAAHVGDMGQVHVHLAFHHAATTMLEYIPWIKHCFEEPIEVIDGYYVRPEQPGAGTTVLPSAMAEFYQPLRQEAADNVITPVRPLEQQRHYE